jgi:predicted transcriptional regulator
MPEATVRTTVDLSQDRADALDAFCRQNDRSKRDVIQCALDAYFETHEDAQEANDG